MRRIELHPVTGRLVIRFGFDARLVRLVKSIPGRTWHASEKYWSVPEGELSRVWRTFAPHGFEPDSSLHGRVSATDFGAPADPVVVLDADHRPEAPRSLFAPDLAQHIRRGSDLPAAGEQSMMDPEAMRRLLEEPLSTRRAAAPRRPPERDEIHRLLGTWDDPSSGNDNPEPARPASPQNRAPAQSVVAAEPRGLSVRQLNDRVRQAVRAAFSRPVWVVAELLGYDRGSRREHVYFELIDKAEGAAQVTAKVSAVLWGDRRALIEHRLRSAPAPFDLRDGLRVRLYVDVELYAKSGRFQVVVRDIDPVFTLGAFAAERAAILMELERRKLIDRNTRRAMPAVPLRVALLTSPSGEAKRDFLAHLRESAIAFQVDLYPVRVQGNLVLESVRRALERVAERADAYDVVVLTRGGGSQADLSWFDNLDLAVQVAELPIKVVVGIGHQRDRTVLASVALAVKTPTAAGVALTDAVLAYIERQDQAWERIVIRAAVALDNARRRLDRDGARAGTGFTRAMQRSAGELRSIAIRIDRSAQGKLNRASHALAAHTAAVTSRAEYRLKRATSDLDRAERELELLHPARMLEKGYARLRDPDGRVIVSADGVVPGTHLEIEMHDGLIDSTVERVRARPATEPNDD